MSDSATPWTVVHQAPLSMGFSRQEYWSGLPFPLPGNLSNNHVGWNPHLLRLLHWVDSLPLSHLPKLTLSIYLPRKKHKTNRASQVALVVKNLPANAGGAGDLDSIPGSGRFPGRGNGNPLQYSCLENPMDGEA